jgi:hypothetical protein
MSQKLCIYSALVLFLLLASLQAETIPSDADIDKHRFVGKWANVDDMTDGLTRIEIAETDKGWTIQA